MAKTVKTDLVITINGKQIEDSFNGISAEVKKLEKDIKKLTPGTEDFKKKAEELKEAKAQFERIKNEIAEVNSTLDKSGALLDSTKGKFSKFAEAVTTVVTGNLLTDFLSNIAGAAKDSVGELLEISDAMTGVEKTSGLAAEKVRELWNDFDALDTRTGKKELLDIAQIGGRLGITDKDQLREFTEEIDKIYVALGDSFQGGLEAVTTKVGKLKNLFAETKEEGYGEALNAIGSALNELGANGTASEENISDFATRIGQLPEALKPSIAQTLGLGAAFEESGIDAEIASSGYSRFMSVAGTNVEAFAKQMRMSAEEAKALFETKPEEFFLKFAQSMKGLGAEGTAEVLKGLKLNTLEVQKAIGAAGDNADRFRELMSLAGEAMEEGTSIQEEFNKVNNNTAAIWEKIKKVWKETFTSELVQGFFSYIVQALGWLTGVTSKAGDGVKVFRERIAFLLKTIGVCVAAVVSYKAAVSLAAVATKEAWQQSLLYNAALKVKTALMQAGRAAALLFSAVIRALSLNFKKAGEAMQAFNAITKANPWGLVAAAASAVVTAVALFNREQKEANRQAKLFKEIQAEVSRAVEEEKRSIRTLVGVINDETKSRREREIAMKKLQEIAPEYFKTLDIDKLKTDEGRKAIDQYVASLKTKRELERVQSKLKEKEEKLEEAKKKHVKDYKSSWNPVNWGRNLDDYADTYEEELAKKRKYFRDLQAKGQLTEAQVKESEQHWARYLKGFYKDKTDAVQALQDDISALEKAEKVLVERQISEEAQSPAATAPVVGVEAQGDKEKAAQAKDYSKEYEAAKRARLEAEQALQKEIGQGLEESLDKQLATTEQKYNEKKFKLQQENATLEQEIGTLAAEKSKDPNREKAIAEKRKLMELNKQIEVAYEQQKEQDLLQVREKYQAKEAERRVKERGREIEALRRQKSEEIIAIQSLEEAKAQLKGSLSERELAQLKTLEQAKKALREQAERELLEASLKNFEQQKQILMGYLSTLSGEAKEKLVEDISQLEGKMLQAREKLDEIKNHRDTKEEKAAGAELEKVDVLGFTAKDWEDTFAHLDEMGNRFKAVDMTFGAMQQAMQQFSALQGAQDQKSLAEYIRSQERQKQALLARLNQGAISQAQYQKEVQRLDEQTAAKKRALELRQFQAQKSMNMLSIMANTATAIMRAYSDTGPVLGSVFAAVVAALGAVQLGVVSAQQPPAYAKGGYTRGLGVRDQSGEEVAGVVHGGEYVIPRWLLKEPEVAALAQWIEGRRQGAPQGEGYAQGGAVAPQGAGTPAPAGGGEGSQSALIPVLRELASAIDKLTDEPLQSYLVADARAGKELRRAIKDYEALRESAKY